MLNYRIWPVNVPEEQIFDRSKVLFYSNETTPSCRPSAEMHITSLSLFGLSTVSELQPF